MTAPEFLKKYLSVLSNEQFNRIEDFSVGIKPDAIFSDKEIKVLNQKLSDYNILPQTAKRNNEGIALEQKGQIDEAIKVYEENIKVGYPATHSFERLMIIYRHLKRYDDEIRVINKAIEIFSKENERRFEKAIINPENESIKNELQTGLEICTQVMGTKGWYVFVPYPVIEYSKRLTKAIKLKNKT